MIDKSEVRQLEIDGLVIKYRDPGGVGPSPVVMMFHGWTGDEDSMWVFEGKMPSDALLIAPRGIYPSSFGGYSWYGEAIGEWPELKHYSEALTVIDQIKANGNFSQGDFSNLRLVGFSQGAALSYSYALTHPHLIRSIAGLSGFLPGGTDGLVESRPLANLPIFVAHGTQDQLVPVERARSGVELLQRFGAKVTYCEDNVGHKLSASCYRGMQEFLRRN